MRKLAKDLKPGDRFKVEPPDPEGPVRVCLSNDGTATGIKWGFPNSPFWCWMGSLVEVEVIEHDFQGSIRPKPAADGAG